MFVQQHLPRCACTTAVATGSEAFHRGEWDDGDGAHVVALSWPGRQHNAIPPHAVTIPVWVGHRARHIAERRRAGVADADAHDGHVVIRARYSLLYNADSPASSSELVSRYQTDRAPPRGAAAGAGGRRGLAPPPSAMGWPQHLSAKKTGTTTREDMTSPHVNQHDTPESKEWNCEVAVHLCPPRCCTRTPLQSPLRAEFRTGAEKDGTTTAGSTILPD
eukprot:gene1257-biopygen7741